MQKVDEIPGVPVNPEDKTVVKAELTSVACHKSIGTINREGAFVTLDCIEHKCALWSLKGLMCSENADIIYEV